MESRDATAGILTTSSSSPLVAVNSSSSTDDGGLDLVSALWIFGAPVVFVVGICGNALVLVVTSLRRPDDVTVGM